MYVFFLKKRIFALNLFCSAVFSGNAKMWQRFFQAPLLYFFSVTSSLSRREMRRLAHRS